MADIATAALVLAIFNTISQLIVGVRMKHCHSGCFDSDCLPASPRHTLAQVSLPEVRAEIRAIVDSVVDTAPEVLPTSSA